MEQLTIAGRILTACVLSIVASGFVGLAFLKLLIAVGGTMPEPAEPQPTAKSDIRP
jgi:hypothetical protein